MDHFAGLDVSVKETSVCIVDDTGKLVREVKVASEPEALLSVLKSPPTASNGLDWKPAATAQKTSPLPNATLASRKTSARRIQFNGVFPVYLRI